jgi:hypothetical protein
MTNTFELVALALSGDVAPESLPAAVKRLIADCWPGMSCAQLVARARRHALHPSLRAHGASAPGETGHFSLTLMVDGAPVRLVAHLRRSRSAVRRGRRGRRKGRGRRCGIRARLHCSDGPGDCHHGSTPH